MDCTTSTTDEFHLAIRLAAVHAHSRQHPMLNDHPTQASLVPAPWPNRTFVYGFDHLHSGFFVLETAPSKGKQFARTQGVAHVELQQDTIAQGERGERIPRLLPGECRLVRVVQMSRRGDLARRTLGEKVLFDCLNKDVFQECSAISPVESERGLRLDKVRLVKKVDDDS